MVNHEQVVWLGCQGSDHSHLHVSGVSRKMDLPVWNKMRLLWCTLRAVTIVPFFSLLWKGTGSNREVNLFLFLCFPLSLYHSPPTESVCVFEWTWWSLLFTFLLKRSSAGGNPVVVYVELCSNWEETGTDILFILRHVLLNLKTCKWRTIVTTKHCWNTTLAKIRSSLEITALAEVERKISTSGNCEWVYRSFFRCRCLGLTTPWWPSCAMDTALSLSLNSYGATIWLFLHNIWLH